MLERGSWTKSWLTTAWSVEPNTPFISPSEAAFRVARSSSLVQPFLVLMVRSTMETSGVGTRTAMPVRTPLSSGMTLPTALAAPVEEGIKLATAAPVLAPLGGPIYHELGGRACVDRSHEALCDTVLVVDDLSERGEAVGRARGVGDNVGRTLVVLVVHPHDVHGRVGARGRDDDLLGPAA